MSSDFDNLRSEILAEQISKAVSDKQSNWRSNLEEIGFEWHNDSSDEVINSVSTNAVQQKIIDYLNGKAHYDSTRIDDLIQEVEQSEAPLFISHFEQGNERLLKLLTVGLERYPTSDTLLSGLAYFHEHRPILSRLIEAYLRGCNEESDMEMLHDRCISFILVTEADGYDAKVALRELFKSNQKKLSAINAAITELENGSDEVITF